jgi:catechol 2,3-dioxygenase-like lactoylglutathione lyase family enzyme
MGITGFNHLYVETRSFEKASAFWEGLGFRFVMKWGEDGHKAGKLQCGDASIVLAESGEPCPVTPHFSLSGADAFAAGLEGKSGVRVTTPLEDTHWGSRWIRVSDADGNEFALEAPLTEAPVKKASPKKKTPAKKAKAKAKKR